MLKTVMNIVLGLLCCVGSAHAIEARDVPEPLKPWVGWALHGVQQAGCPFFYQDADDRHCVWGEALELRLDDGGGHFSQFWQVWQPGWVALPGNAEHWPQSVSVDGKPAAVTLRDGAPALRLEPGRYHVAGAFEWRRLPEAIALPAQTGLVALTLKGQPVAHPYLDEQHQLWLQRRAEELRAEDHLDLRVHRLLDDEIPATLATRLQLSVSGKAREIVLPSLLLQGFIPQSLSSPLPARLEPDGRLRVQARAGTWEISFVARHDGPLAALALPASQASLAQEEVWAFNAHNQLRLVNVEGVAALDPQQTTLPDEWKHFPAYRLRAGDTLSLKEKKRGDPEPAPDQLNLQRTVWLDFDGGGYTARDQIGGVIHRGWRLDMALPATLGRVAVDGGDQMITQGPGGVAGVELRQGKADLVAESRLKRDGTSLPAVGWLQDFQSASAELRLPPGWKLFAAGGVDHAPGTWLESWDLLDIFLVLMVAFATAKLWGRNWGALALLTMALVYPEADAPQWVWLHLLAAVALVRYLPAGAAMKAAQGYRTIAFVSLLVIGLPFAVQQIRVGLFPALEKPWVMAATREAPLASMPAPAAPEPAAAEIVEDDAAAQAELRGDAKMKMDKGVALSASIGGRLAAKAPPEPLRKSLNLAEHDPAARIQTGPGLPEWTWNSYQLSWSGPVRHDQSLRLWLLSPAMNLLLGFVRVALLLVLAWRVLDVPRPRFPLAVSGFKTRAASLAVLAVLVGSGLPTERAWADIPSNELLEQLKQRLNEPPACLPECAASPRLLVEASGNRLLLRQEIHALADVAVPLPGGGKNWQPQRVLLDGEPQAGLLREGDVLWLNLPRGSHQVLLEGALGERESVDVSLPLRPYRVNSTLAGWTLEGVNEGARPDEALRLKRTQPVSGSADQPANETLPAFVQIERRLQLGLKWQVETRVIRRSPPGSAVLLTVPLLPGESLLTEGIRAEQGQVKVSLAPDATELVWESDLKESAEILLQAAKQNQWTETWRIDASPIWHVEFGGIPPIGHQDAAGMRQPTFRPWPGEALKISVSRPQGIAGQTLTMDGTQLTVNPGIRDTDATLEIRLRSSQGGQHAVTLPANAELMAVRIDGQEQPIRAQNGKVVLPVVPGTQVVALAFRQPEGMGWHKLTPLLDLGMTSVNARITVAPPQDRWTLFLGGPRLGPAVLFWGVLLVLAMVAWGLGKVPLTPLKTYEWLLLGLGLTQTPPETGLVIVGWLLALGWRGREGDKLSKNGFNGVQLLLGLWTLAALSALFYAIQHGLLGLPEMQIAGNGSSGYSLNWFQDRSGNALPQAWVISVPLWVYRFLMLAWALWLAAALMRWLRWGWSCYAAGGVWRKLVLSKPAATAASGDEKPHQ